MLVKNFFVKTCKPNSNKWRIPGIQCTHSAEMPMNVSVEVHVLIFYTHFGVLVAK